MQVKLRTVKSVKWLVCYAFISKLTGIFWHHRDSSVFTTLIKWRYTMCAVMP